jgi:hypothetical protein
MQKLITCNLKLQLLSLLVVLFTLAIADESHFQYNENRLYVRRSIIDDNSDTSIDIPDPPASVPEPRNLITIQTLSRIGNDGKPQSVFPLQKCQGDCDTDADCAPLLKCYRRLAGDDITKIPGCTTTNVAELTNDASDYCYNPNDSIVPKTPTKPSSPVKAPVSSPTKVIRGTILFVGEDWVPKDAYPLGICEGDCDGDYDCAGELVCHQRQKGENTVPGCTGQDTTTRDYCIHPNDELAKPPVNGAFRLKKYWQFGYKWQDEFWEQEWCAQCTGGTTDGCEVDDTVHISYCSHDRSTWFVYKNLKNNVAQIQVADKSNLCLQLVGNNDIFVKVCDGANTRQKFKALNGTFGSSGKFELGTTAVAGCISQEHHPKDGEILFRMDCALTRKHTTSYWTQY